MNHDQLKALMEADELADGIESGQLQLMSVRDYAKARGIRPQLMYYYMRGPNPKIETDFCECGRKCVRVEEADKFFAEKDSNPMDKDEADDSGGSSSTIVDTR